MLNDSLFSSDNENWNTPEWLVNVIRAFGFGSIDLDPCSNSNSVVRAKEEWFDKALERTWRGRGLVYSNPPYSRQLSMWADHIASDWKISSSISIIDLDQLILLVPSRTDTNWWHTAISSASAVLFFKGRLKFGEAVNSAPFPSALIYYGKSAQRFIQMFGPLGWAIQLREPPVAQ